MEQALFRNYVQEEYLRRKERNPGYSLRSFAKQLKIDVGSLSQFLNGRRQYGFKKLSQLALSLGLDSQHAEKLFANDDKMKLEFIELDRLHLISKWYYAGILECLALDGFEPNPIWIAGKLNLSVSVINVALNQLFTAGVLKIQADGTWHNNWLNYSTQENEKVDQLALRNHQKQLLKLAEESIDNNTADEKSHTAYLSAMDSGLISEIQDEIRKFRRKIANLIENKSLKRDCIYCLQLNLFPEVKPKLNLKKKKSSGGSRE